MGGSRGDEASRGCVRLPHSRLGECTYDASAVPNELTTEPRLIQSTPIGPVHLFTPADAVSRRTQGCVRMPLRRVARDKMTRPTLW